MKLKLDTQVELAIELLLQDREEDVTVEVVLDALPSHIRSAAPSRKAVVRAIMAAGWRTGRTRAGTVVYTRPGSPDGDDPMPEGGNIAADELRLLIERTERLEEEKKGIADDIKDVMAEAKGRGYDPKAIRKILSIRKKKKEEYQEEEAILEVYMQALGMI
jgi:uncharacterized protein (UPF0335 family)